MRSKISKIIISETSDEIKSLVKEYAKKIMDDKLKKEYLRRIMKARLIEDQITLLEQFGDEYAQSRQAAVSGSVCVCEGGAKGRTVDEDYKQICEVCGRKAN